MTPTRLIWGLLAMLLFPMAGLCQQQEVDAPRKPLERFDGKITVRAKDGRARELHVVVRNWIIDNRKNIADFPERGFMVVRLLSGELTTVIDGKREVRHEDTSWTVNAGSTMRVETGNDTVVIQTMTIRNL